MASEKCRKGHPRTPENTIHRTDGYIQCKPCASAARRKAYANRSAARKARDREYQSSYYDDRVSVLGRRRRVPTGEIADHARQLVEVYGSYRQVALRAGLAECTVARIAERETVRARVAEAILAVPVRWPVTGVGVMRRLQALAALGWSAQEVARRVGMHRESVQRLRNRPLTPRGDTAKRIADVYVELCLERPDESDRYAQSSATHTRTLAARHGWVPPLAWDAIDDPDATPDVGEKPKYGADIDEWMFLIEGGEDPVRACRRLGVTPDAIRTQAQRKGRYDVMALAQTAVSRSRRERGDWKKAA